MVEVKPQFTVAFVCITIVMVNLRIFLFPLFMLFQAFVLLQIERRYRNALSLSFLCLFSYILLCAQTANLNSKPNIGSRNINGSDRLDLVLTSRVPYQFNCRQNPGLGHAIARKTVND
jgi:hypothetical protein